MAPDTVTTEMLRPGVVDQTKYAAFVAKTEKGYRRARDRANARGKADAMYFGWTDEQCSEAAGFYCRTYEHQFRILVPVTKTA